MGGLTRQGLSDIEERELEDLAVQIDASRVAAAWRLIEIGRQLKRAQDLLGPTRSGLFKEWAENRCGISLSKAYSAIQCCERFGSFQNLENLQASAIVLLSQDNIPIEACDEAIERAEAGEEITHRLAKEIVSKRKPKRRQGKKSNDQHDYDQDELDDGRPAPDSPPVKSRRGKRINASEIIAALDAVDTSIAAASKLIKATKGKVEIDGTLSPVYVADQVNRLERMRGINERLREQYPSRV